MKGKQGTNISRTNKRNSILSQSLLNDLSIHMFNNLNYYGNETLVFLSFRTASSFCAGLTEQKIVRTKRMKQSKEFSVPLSNFKGDLYKHRHIHVTAVPTAQG